MRNAVVKPAQVWKRLGMADADAALQGDFTAAYDRACGTLQLRRSCRSYELMPAAAAGEVRLRTGVVIRGGGTLGAVTGDGRVLYVFAATCGADLDEFIDDLNARGEHFAMTVADAVGSVAAEEVIRELYGAARQSAARAGMVLGRRVSPGYGDFGLAEQAVVLPLAGGDDIGISLTDKYMMVPRKSVTAVAVAK